MLFKPIQRESAPFCRLGWEKWAPQRPEVSRGPWLIISCSRYAYGPILAVFFFFLVSLMSGARCEERSTKSIFEVKSEDVGTVEEKSVFYG